MRGPLAFLLAPVAAILIEWAWAGAAESGFPYKAYITADNVQVRSGPGDNYYPTDKLKTGDEVEVYRNDPGGWLAIRPPRGSFSFVRSHSMQPDRQGLVIAAEDRVAVRVGSNLSDSRDVIQVRLHSGESVELFDARGGGDNAAPRGNDLRGTDPWYKIMPPSGEFRWVPGRYVDASFPKSGIGKSPIDLSQRATAVWPAGQASNAFQKSLSSIDLELSAMVAEPSSDWDFTELRNRTQNLFDRASSPLERGRARAVLERIARFDDIRRREAALAASPAAAPAQAATSTAPSTIGPSQGDSRFDAVGQLARVPEPSPGGPQYAILDSSGNIRCYVSPAPGVNLRSYIGHQVGITGIRGYMPEQRATHIMARHVNVVEGSVVR